MGTLNAVVLAIDCSFPSPALVQKASSVLCTLLSIVRTYLKQSRSAPVRFEVQPADADSFEDARSSLDEGEDVASDASGGSQHCAQESVRTFCMAPYFRLSCRFE